MVVEMPSVGKNGLESRTCVKCNFEERREIVCSHDDTVNEVIQESTCNTPGVEMVSCVLCETVWEREIDKIPHAETYAVSIKDPSCLENGMERICCKECNEIIEERAVEKTECAYGDWIIVEYATPFEAGNRHRVCCVCGNKEVEEYSITMENNSIYIPSAGIHCDFTVSSFTQSAVDNNDVVYTNKAFSVYDETNPFVLGHWYGSLGDMYKTKVEGNIYVCVNNNIDTYEVIVSEYAVLSGNEIDIFGVNTSVNIWDTYGSRLNSPWCIVEGVAHKGVDRWEDENDGKTLHMYTCHYGKDKINWESKHGRNGRWIVMGNLIDTQPMPIT